MLISRTMPSFIKVTLKFNSSPIGLPVSLKYVSSWASWTGRIVATAQSTLTPH